MHVGLTDQLILEGMKFLLMHDYYPQRRYMERVTIKGGPVTGVPRADAASLKRAKYVAPEGVDTHGGHKPH